jgi:hypothetical protein
MTMEFAASKIWPNLHNAAGGWAKKGRLIGGFGLKLWLPLPGYPLVKKDFPVFLLSHLRYSFR